MFYFKNGQYDFDRSIIPEEVGFFLTSELRTIDDVSEVKQLIIGAKDKFCEYNGQTGSVYKQNEDFYIDSEYCEGVYPYKIDAQAFLEVLEDWKSFLIDNRFKRL